MTPMHTIGYPSWCNDAGVIVVSFSVDFVWLSSTEQKQCGSVDSIELVVVK